MRPRLSTRQFEGSLEDNTMLRVLLFTIACMCAPIQAQFDASAAQRRAAFTNVGAPATSVRLPFLSNVSSLQPNTTFLIPNTTAGTESAGNFDYRLALTLPWKYMKAERLGKLPADNDIPWRADAFLQDPVPNGLGDAGDFLVCQFPLGQSLTLLALSIIEFGAGHANAGSTADALDALRWGADLLIASRMSDVDTVVQVGNSGVDHSTWLPAEQSATIEGKRPAYTVTPSVPGSDAQGAMAGALAAASIVFSGDDKTYSRHLLANARDLYALASTFQGLYNSLGDPGGIYPSSSFYDDLAFAGALLYLSTNQSHFLTDAMSFYSKLGQISTYSFNWDQKQAGAALYIGLLLPAPANQQYLTAVSSFLTSWADGKDGVVTTPQGLKFLSQWGPLRYAMSAATIGAIYAKRVPSDPNAAKYRSFVHSQVDYVLGSSNNGYSYLIGFGQNYPRRPHNRGASCNGPSGPCGFSQFSKEIANPNELTGAMVGGPDQQDVYRDARDNFQGGEPALDYVTALLTPLASLA